jgi:two-component system phosphate regulon sensor histidine kinase PhoR
VRADKDRIQQVIENLIVNSIKYGKRMVPLKWRWLNLTKKKVLIESVIMEGIDKQNIPRLFERFIASTKAVHDQRRIWIRTSIVKHIIRAHKEKIYVER